MAKFDRFLLFSASPECKWKVRSEAGPKTAEIDQGAEAKVVGDHLAQLCRTEPPTFKMGYKLLQLRSTSLSTLSARREGGSVFQNQNGDV